MQHAKRIVAHFVDGTVDQRMPAGFTRNGELVQFVALRIDLDERRCRLVLESNARP
jgi:hypothetical protein